MELNGCDFSQTVLLTFTVVRNAGIIYSGKCITYNSRSNRNAKVYNEMHP